MIALILLAIVAAASASGAQQYDQRQIRAHGADARQARIYAAQAGAYGRQDQQHAAQQQHAAEQQHAAQQQYAAQQQHAAQQQRRAAQQQYAAQQQHAGADVYRRSYSPQHESYGHQAGPVSFQYTFLKGDDLINAQHAQKAQIGGPQAFAIAPPQYADAHIQQYAQIQKAPQQYAQIQAARAYQARKAGRFADQDLIAY